MSLPVEIDFSLIKMGDGGSPSETFTTICGLQNVTVNRTVNSNDRFPRDCAQPGAIPNRRVKVTSQQTDVSGSGLINMAQYATVTAALGKPKNYKIEHYSDDGSNAGVLIGTDAGSFVMTSQNINSPREEDGSVEIQLKSHGAVTYTAA